MAETKRNRMTDGWVFVVKQLIVPLILASIIGLTGYLMALDRKTTKLEVKMETALTQIADTCKAMKEMQQNLINVYTEQSLSAGERNACRELTQKNAQAIEKLIEMHLHQ